MSLIIEKCLGHVTLQGLPRTGFRHYGLPPGGAFEPATLTTLNLVLGNPTESLGLELALAQLEIRFTAPTWVALGGATATTQVNIVPYVPVKFRAGDLLSLHPPRRGCRSWVAIAGGLVGTDELRAKNELKVGEPHLKRSSWLPLPSVEGSGNCLRAIAGDPRFAAIFEETYTVGLSSDRVGIRLNGGRMAHQFELPSRPATLGTVQVTADGQPVILGPDGPTIGGYPQAATVIAADIPKLAQLRPSDAVSFAPISIEEARAASPLKLPRFGTDARPT